MRLAAWAAAGCFVLSQALATPPAGAPAAKTMPPANASSPHGAMSGAPPMRVSPSTADRIVWSCQAGDLGNPAVMVDFVGKTALSTRSAGMAKATLEGDKVRWTETEPDGTLQYVLDRRTGALQVTRTPPKGKQTVYTGKCAAPDRNTKGANHG